MVLRLTYESAKTSFDQCGLGARRKGRMPYSSNFKELSRAFQHLGYSVVRKRFTGWDCIQGPCVVKVKWTAGQNWHWVAATREPASGLYLLDPATGDFFLEHLKPGQSCMPLSYFPATGCFLALQNTL